MEDIKEYEEKLEELESLLLAGDYRVDVESVKKQIKIIQQQIEDIKEYEEN